MLELSWGSGVRGSMVGFGLRLGPCVHTLQGGLKLRPLFGVYMGVWDLGFRV